ncbi:hypothetical protein EBR96_07715 [bacterium]|nr:hypothetical protein [bacterium]
MLAPVHQRHITMPTDFGTSARTVAIGSILGLDTLASSLFENPAALPKDPGTHYSTFFTTFSDGNSALLAMAAAYPLDKGTVAIGFVQKRNPYLDAGFLENNTHFSSAANYALTESLYKLGYELPLTSHTSIGASIHYYTQDLYVTQGHGLNADLGIRIENGPFLVSVVGSNLLNSSSVAYTGGYPNVDFPSDTIISSRYAASDKLALFGQFKGVQGLKAFGFRYAFLPTMELQAGWREIQSLGLHSQWSMGTSIVMSPKIKIHLSWQPREATITDSYVGFSIDIQP